jgi:hypothetical protein
MTFSQRALLIASAAIMCGPSAAQAGMFSVTLTDLARLTQEKEEEEQGNNGDSGADS